MSGGNYRSLGIKADGGLVAWGNKGLRSHSQDQQPRHSADHGTFGGWNPCVEYTERERSCLGHGVATGI